MRVKISGHRALSLISTHGNIEINSPLNISGSALFLGSSVKTSIGGYVKTVDDGADAGRDTVFSNLQEPLPNSGLSLTGHLTIRKIV